MKIILFFNSDFRERIVFETPNSAVDCAIEIAILAASSYPIIFDLSALAAFFDASEPDTFELLLIGLEQRLWEFKIVDEKENSKCSDGSNVIQVNSPWPSSQVEQSKSSLQSALSSMSPMSHALPQANLDALSALAEGSVSGSLENYLNETLSSTNQNKETSSKSTSKEE